MKKIALGVLSIVVCMLFFSCSQSYESQADTAYSQSKKTVGYDKKILEKRAYIFYQKALKATPDKSKIGLRFKQRFLEITLNRAYMVLNEGSYDMDAIHLFMADIDSTMDQETPTELRQRYSDFLSMMSDSCLSRGQLQESLDWLSKAVKFTGNPSVLEDKKTRIIADYSKQFLDMGKDAFNQSKEDKDPELAVKAEYFVQLALIYDPNMKEALSLLSELRKTNVASISGYAKVVEGKLDKRVNKFDIFLAISKNAKNAMTVTMFNNSYNPQRLKPENFFLVNEKGQKFKAAPSSKIDPEILDTQHETKTIRLVFPSASGTIKKLVYENGEHYSEKILF